MASSRANAQRTSPGPWGWENARERREDETPLGTVEIACYTDRFYLSTDPVSSGPYTVLSPLSVRQVPYRRSELPRMGLVLRVEQHLERDPDEYLDAGWEQLDTAVYHGGNAWQELAALLSLALGIRLRAGGITRVFHESDDDARGYPHEMEAPPYLPQPSTFPMLPYTGDGGHAVDFSGVKLLDSYPCMSAKQARALVRSARSYQEAIWIADSDPRQAWLRLVTAVEAVAQLQPDEPAAVRLQAVYPEIAERLSRCGDQELLEWVTKRFADQGKSTAKFLGFLKHFRPPVPRSRPRAPSQRLNWHTLQDQLKDIYSARSKDLHQGVPFPRSMCETPYVSPAGVAWEIAYVRPDSPGKAPMHLHVFEYVVRSALQSWWRSFADAVKT
jgi:hypothetical protein